MLNIWILVFLCAFVVAALADKDGQIQWNEHFGLCRSPTSYRIKEHVKTAKDCKEICAKDHRCVMVKYNKRRRKCWLSDNKSLRPSTKCAVKHDFYIKVLPAPKISWMKELRTCKVDKPYKTWFIETAHECKTTCAEGNKCKMVKYSPEERKCFFSSSTELKPSNKCMVKYDFYTKVPQAPEMKWIEHIKLCRSISTYEVISAYTAEHCKGACARDEKCSMVVYYAEENKCWKSYSLNMQHTRNCSARYDFYQKDRCATMKKQCKDEALCMNNGRNHSCLAECPIGYYEANQVCKDVNECDDNPGLCGKDAECFNILGSVKCICGIGYEWNGKECTDFNECSTGICGKHRICKNTIGSYSCSCSPGFKKTGKRCVDMDECAMDLSICFNLSKCINTVGSYRCGCIAGSKCKESTKAPEIQPSKAPEAPSFKKKQMHGFGGHGSEQGMDYPEVQTDYPDKETEYPPTMYTEYIEDETEPTEVLVTKHPEELTLSPLVTTTKATTIMSISQLPTSNAGQLGNKPTDIAVVQVTKIPEIVLRELWISHPKLCLSVSYYELFHEVNSEKRCRWQCEQQKKCLMVQYDSNTGKCWLCDDRKMNPKAGCNKPFDYYIKGRNECVGKRGKCHRNAVCKASRGHRVCQCIYGFKGDGWGCKDINECSYYKNLCGESAECVNTIGSYSCKCKRGFDRQNGRCRKKGRSALQDSKTKYDFIKQWKREHSAATSVYVSSAWTLISAFFLSQFIFL